MARAGPHDMPACHSPHTGRHTRDAPKQQRRRRHRRRRQLFACSDASSSRSPISTLRTHDTNQQRNTRAAAGPRGAPSIVLPHQEATYVRHIALDIGGSLIKLVYFSPDDDGDHGGNGGGGGGGRAGDGGGSSSSSGDSVHGSADGSGGGGGGGGAGAAAAADGQDGGRASAASASAANGAAGAGAGAPPPPKGGRIHFVKFETARIRDCLDFIEAKGLHRCLGRDGFRRETRVKATGGGAHRFADMFRERLGLVIEKEDEIGCAVGGCNFLLRAIGHEAFTFSNGQSNFLTFPSERAWRAVGGGAVWRAQQRSGESGTQYSGEGSRQRATQHNHDAHRPPRPLPHYPYQPHPRAPHRHPCSRRRPLPLPARQHRLGRLDHPRRRRRPVHARERLERRRRHVLGALLAADGAARL